jgi:hypothetical protein
MPRRNHQVETTTPLARNGSDTKPLAGSNT